MREKKKINKPGVDRDSGHVCEGEKQEKRKRKREMKHKRNETYGWKWTERKEK